MCFSLHHNKASLAFLFFNLTLLLRSQECISAAVVTLNSLDIYKTHEWFHRNPTVYFQCKGENKTILPDVMEKHVTYMFHGEESWQPVTEIQSRKCKRCGFYEKEPIKSDDVFDEWELCASDFNTSDGRYTHFKKKEFNAAFVCVGCASMESDTKSDSEKSPASQNEGKGMHWAIILVISVLVSTIFIFGLVSGVKFYQNRRRRKEQARFLRLFEDDDDIEKELGIGQL